MKTFKFAFALVGAGTILFDSASAECPTPENVACLNDYKRKFDACGDGSECRCIAIRSASESCVIECGTGNEFFELASFPEDCPSSQDGLLISPAAVVRFDGDTSYQHRDDAIRSPFSFDSSVSPYQSHVADDVMDPSNVAYSRYDYYDPAIDGAGGPYGMDRSTYLLGDERHIDDDFGVSRKQFEGPGESYRFGPAYEWAGEPMQGFDQVYPGPPFERNADIYMGSSPGGNLRFTDAALPPYGDYEDSRSLPNVIPSQRGFPDWEESLPNAYQHETQEWDEPSRPIEYYPEFVDPRAGRHFYPPEEHFSEFSEKLGPVEYMDEDSYLPPQESKHHALAPEIDDNYHQRLQPIRSPLGPLVYHPGYTEVYGPVRGDIRYASGPNYPNDHIWPVQDPYGRRRAEPRHRFDEFGDVDDPTSYRRMYSEGVEEEEEEDEEDANPQNNGMLRRLRQKLSWVNALSVGDDNVNASEDVEVMAASDDMDEMLAVASVGNLVKENNVADEGMVKVIPSSRNFLLAAAVAASAIPDVTVQESEGTDQDLDSDSSEEPDAATTCKPEEAASTTSAPPTTTSPPPPESTGSEDDEAASLTPDERERLRLEEEQLRIIKSRLSSERHEKRLRSSEMLLHLASATSRPGVWTSVVPSTSAGSSSTATAFATLTVKQKTAQSGADSSKLPLLSLALGISLTCLVAGGLTTLL